MIVGKSNLTIHLYVGSRFNYQRINKRITGNDNSTIRVPLNLTAVNPIVFTPVLSLFPMILRRGVTIRIKGVHVKVYISSVDYTTIYLKLKQCCIV